MEHRLPCSSLFEGKPVVASGGRGRSRLVSRPCAADAGTLYQLPDRWQYSTGTAQAVLAALVASSVGLTGFVVTVSVLIVQMATGTFSARYMRIFYRDRTFKAVLAVLIGTFVFSYTLLRHVEANSIPNFGITLAGFFMGAGLVLFVFFLDRSIHRLRPVAVAALVAEAGRRALREVLSEATRPDAPDILPAPFDVPGDPALIVRNERGGAIQAINTRGLVDWARAHDSLIVLRHPVGDFVPAGEESSPADRAFQYLVKEELEHALNTLNPREKEVLVLRFGLYDEDPHTLEETGRRLHITRERARQIESKALEKL